jgi:hypothetical protein
MDLLGNVLISVFQAQTYIEYRNHIIIIVDVCYSVSIPHHSGQDVYFSLFSGGIQYRTK